MEYAGPPSATLLDLCVSSLRRGHANLLCIVPILSDDPQKESDSAAWQNIGIVDKLVLALSTPRAPRGSHAGPTQAPLSLDSSAAKREIPRAGTRDPRGSYAGPTRVPRGSHAPSTPYLPSSFSCKTRLKDRITPHAYFFRKSVAVDTIGSLSKGTSECASVSQ